MSGTRQAELPDPNALGRQPFIGSAGADGGEERAPTPEEAVEEARQRIEQSNQERDRERARSQSLQRERDEARARAASATTEVESAQERAVVSGIEQQKSIVDRAKTAIVTAQSAGDAIAVADAYEQLAEAKARMTALEGQQAWLAQQKATRPTQRTDGDRQSAATDQAEVSTPGGTMRVGDAAKQWMDRHQRFYDDASYYNHAVAAHSTIVADGISEGSPAYFRSLDQAMERYEKFEAYERGDGGHQVQNEQRPAPQQRRTNPASMGAPPMRGGGPGTQNRNTPLSAEAVARRIGPGVTVEDLREFARHNGYKGEEGFQSYLKAQQEIADIERSGGDTGLRVDGVYR